MVEVSSSEHEPSRKKKCAKRALPKAVASSSSEEDGGSDTEEAEITRYLKSMTPQDEREPLPKVMVKRVFQQVFAAAL